MERFGVVPADIGEPEVNSSEITASGLSEINPHAVSIMAESKEINPDSWGDFSSQADGEVEKIPNKQRGCGYLKAGNAYIRCDPESFSKNGTIPGFVVFTDSNGDLHPIPYKESLPRGYETLNGSNFLAAAKAQREVRCLYPGSPDAEQTHQEAHQEALMNQVEFDLYEDLGEVPDSELERHLDRMALDGFDGGDHWGNIPAANSKDLMMRVGKSYYEEPWDFIDEALELGLNKGISVHSNKSPPTIQPGRTRVWLIHPHACGEDMPGVIGFSYLTRTVYTLDKDGEVPAYAEDYADADKLDVVDIGEPEPREEDEERDHDDIAKAHQALDSFDFSGESETGPEAVEVAEGATFESDHIEDMEKAELADLANENWIPANHPPEEYDAIQGGGLMAIVDGRKVKASNNFKWDPEEQHGSSVVGPYTVEVRIQNGDRMILVEE